MAETTTRMHTGLGGVPGVRIRGVHSVRHSPLGVSFMCVHNASRACACVAVVGGVLLVA